jgi:hypothetical protein
MYADKPMVVVNNCVYNPRSQLLSVRVLMVINWKMTVKAV